MTDNKPAADVTKDWQATQGQKSAATRLRLFAALSWIVAIGGQIAGVVLLYQHKFDHGNLPLLIGILVGIARGPKTEKLGRVPSLSSVPPSTSSREI